MAVPNPTGSFPAKTNSAQLPCSFPRPAFWSPLGRNQGRISRIGPGRPVRASFRGWAAGGLPCAARTWRVLGGFWRVVGTGPWERPRPGARRLSAWMVIAAPWDFSVKEWRVDVSAPRARDTCSTQTGLFRAHPHPPADRSTDGVEEGGIVYLHYYFHSLSTLSPEIICRRICRRSVGGYRHMRG